MKIYSYSELKKRHREERDAYPQPLALRVHRALSWLDCVAITDRGPAERGDDAEHHLDRLASDHAAVVTMQHLRLSSAAFFPDRLLHQVAGVDGALFLVHFPAYDQVG